MTEKEAWELVRKLGHLSHTYEWDGKTWIVREKTQSEQDHSQRIRTDLQQTHDNSLPCNYQKFYQ